VSPDPEVTINIAEVERALDRLAKWGKDMTKMHRHLRRPLMRDQKRHQTQRVGSNGAWRQLSPFTIERKKARARAKGKGASRKMLGKLPLAFRAYATAQSLKLISRVEWSGAHQEGSANAGRAPSIPAREFYWISTRAMREFVDIIEERAGKTWLGMHL
jgi:phage gpG-like protein